MQKSVMAQINSLKNEGLLIEWSIPNFNIKVVLHNIADMEKKSHGWNIYI